MTATEAVFATQRWADPDWRNEALTWVDDRLTEVGAARVGDPEPVHARAWSAVFRVPTDAGTVYVKANAVGTAHEVPLLAALAGWVPEHVLHPLAVDVRRGWLLLPDGGTTLRSAQGGWTDVAHWEEILRDHAELQRLLAPRADEMVRLGVPDLRPARLPQVRADLLDDERALRLGRPDGLTPEQRGQLRDDATTYAALCAELDALGVPATLQHDDLHDNNVFVPERPGGHYRVFDWGDSTVAHPFAVLLVALRVAAHLHRLPYGDPQLLRLRDAYLEPWSGDFDRDTLLEACRLSARVGGVSRARCYRAALLEGTPADHEEYGNGVPSWLLEFYQPTPVEPVSAGLGAR